MSTGNEPTRPADDDRTTVPYNLDGGPPPAEPDPASTREEGTREAAEPPEDHRTWTMPVDGVTNSPPPPAPGEGTQAMFTGEPPPGDTPPGDPPAPGGNETRALPTSVLGRGPGPTDAAPPTRPTPPGMGSRDLGSARQDISGGWGTIGSDGKLEPGQVVFGRYLVKKQLGRGGMGTVWLVRHVTLDTDRALKLIVANIAFDPQARARFRREAQVMARFSHPNAVTVHDAMLTNDVAFIEMEYVPGKSLTEVFVRGTPMPLDWVGRIAGQLCDALQVAHEQGIVHRDLKPSNLMLLAGRPAGKEFLKVLDFGIAKILGVEDQDGEVHTMTNAFMGTPPYTSPEQANGKADARSDIYSVGVILYEFLTGHRPFTGPVAKQISDTLHAAPPPFRQANPKAEVPAELEALVLRCLAKDPVQRPQTARELGDLLERALPGPAGSDSETTAWRKPAARRRVPVAAVVAGVLLLVAGGLAASRNWSTTTGRDPRSQKTGGGRDEGPKKPPDAVDFGFPPRFTLPPDSDPGTLTAPPPILEHKDGPRFRYIAGGTLRKGMYESGPGGKLTVSEGEETSIAGFYLAETEVTNGQFRRYLKEKGAAPPPKWDEAYQGLLGQRVSEADADRHPAVGVDHDTAEAYARWIGGRLPTAEEWEYAAQSGGKAGHPYVWGDAPAPEIGTIRANIDSHDRTGGPTTKVGLLDDDHTEHGILDMTGNVREWTATKSRGHQEREGDPEKQKYVVCGGSWNSSADRFTTSARADVPRDAQLTDLGFRLALSVPEPLLANAREP